jgi:hypothetical protein
MDKVHLESQNYSDTPDFPRYRIEDIPETTFEHCVCDRGCRSGDSHS